VETDSRLHFPLSEDLNKCCITCGPRPLKLYRGFQAIAYSFSLHSEIVAILGDLQKLHTGMIDINPLYTLDEIICLTTSLRYRLLLCAFNGAADSQSNILSEACRLGFLVYLKPDICCQMTFNDLLRRLEACIYCIEMNTDMKRCEVSEFVLWLVFIGGTTALDGPSRAWFVAHLRKTATGLRIDRWDDVKVVLMKFLWVEKIHEASFLDLWKVAEGLGGGLVCPPG
jgi:hypothetical protein